MLRNCLNVEQKIKMGIEKWIFVWYNQSMSYIEYEDIYQKAQFKQTPYRMVFFDIKGSKLLKGKQREGAQIVSIQTIKYLKSLIEKEEKLTHSKILINQELTQSTKDTDGSLYAYLNNPCVVNGDCFCLYFYRGKLTNDKIFKMFHEACEKCGNKLTYHFGLVNFETLDIGESNNKLYIGDAVGFAAGKKTNTFEISKSLLDDFVKKSGELEVLGE